MLVKWAPGAFPENTQYGYDKTKPCGDFMGEYANFMFNNWGGVNCYFHCIWIVSEKSSRKCCHSLVGYVSNIYINSLIPGKCDSFWKYVNIFLIIDKDNISQNIPTSCVHVGLISKH